MYEQVAMMAGVFLLRVTVFLPSSVCFLAAFFAGVAAARNGESYLKSDWIIVAEFAISSS